jgi:hypothetical protein
MRTLTCPAQFRVGGEPWNSKDFEVLTKDAKPFAKADDDLRERCERLLEEVQDFDAHGASG